MSPLRKRLSSRPRRPAGPAWWVPLGLSAASADVGAYRIHWVAAGESPSASGSSPDSGGERETLVLLHGLSGSSRWWQRNVPAFARTRRVLVPDVIGFGRSRAPGGLPNIATLAEVLAEWIGAVSPGAPVHLAGHSMGGHVAIHLAAKHAERVSRLVLVDAVGIPRERSARSLLRLAYQAAPPRRWGDPRFLPVVWADALIAGPMNAFRGLLHVLRDDVRPLLPRIQAPTLIVWGARDGLVPLQQARALRDGIRGARLLVIERAYHNPMVDRPDAFNAAVARFLDGREVGE